MRIIQIYDKLDRHGGAQSVLKVLDNYMKSKYKHVYIASFCDYQDLFFKNEIYSDRYLKLSTASMHHFKGSIIISHSRKMTTLLVLLNKIFHLNIEIIHISHSIFNSGKLYTLYPKNIIAVSNAVKDNLTKYFNIKEQNIKVIYNGLEDIKSNLEYPTQNKNTIKIAYIGRIEDIKQQVTLVSNLSGQIDKNIKIDFIGNGSEVDELKATIKSKDINNNFNYIGFYKDIPNRILKYDYVMLFSKKEGLGLSLVEGCIVGKPLITKNSGGCEACGEVCMDKYNGFIVNTFENLISTLSNLRNISNEEYIEMCKNSRKVYAEKFKLEIMLSEYSEYIDKIIEGKCSNEK